MAKRVAALEDANTVRRYPWLQWTEEGTIWEIRQGEDYDVPTENMRVNLHERAKHQNQTVKTRVVRDNGPEGLRFAFEGTPMIPTPDGSRRIAPMPVAVQRPGPHADDWRDRLR